MNCELKHEEPVMAVSGMTITCPECERRWKLGVCGEHGRQTNLLIVRGSAMGCQCGAAFPMLYNVMFGVM